jgi:hypothetical protein
MSYPNDNPSLSMATCWQSGSYKPDDVVRCIRDNYTPVNKNSMRNSIGYEVSLVQNYVNSKMLGRSDLTIESGYIDDITSKSGFYSNYIETSASRGGTVRSKLTNSGLYLNNGDTSTSIYTNTTVPTSLTLSGLEAFIYNGCISPTQEHELKVHPQEIYMRSQWAGNDYIDSSLTAIPSSGLNITQTLPPNHSSRPSDYEYVDLTPSGLEWRYYNNDTISRSIKFIANPSGHYINIPNGQLVIGSGLPYSGNAENIGGKHFGLTVGNDHGSGNAFFRTHLGGGVAIFGGQNGGIDAFDYIYSYAPESLNLSCGSSSFTIPSSGNITLPAAATDASTTMTLANAIRALLIERGLAS